MHDKDTQGLPAGPNAPPADEDRLDREIEALREPWSELRGIEPPALLDQAVRNASRRAIEGGRGAARRLRWVGGLATAAVAVLAISLLLLQPEAPRQAAPGGDGFRLEEIGPAEQRSERAGEASKREAFTVRGAPAPEKEATAAARVVEEADAAPAPAPAAAAARADADTEPPGAEAGDFPGPEAWIAEMLELQRRGETDRLAAELQRFRAAYPDHPLPAGLAD